MLILDEPAANLDPIISASLYQAVALENIQKKLTVLSVTHDLDSAIKYADKILSLNRDGYFFGTTEEYLKTRECGCLKGGGKNL